MFLEFELRLQDLISRSSIIVIVISRIEWTGNAEPGIFLVRQWYFFVQHADKPTVICIPIASKGRRTQGRIDRRGSSTSGGGLPAYRSCGCPKAHPGRSFIVWSHTSTCELLMRKTWLFLKGRLWTGSVGSFHTFKLLGLALFKGIFVEVFASSCRAQSREREVQRL